MADIWGFKVFFISTGTKEQLTNCLNNLNKNNSFKFEYKISQTIITFLDTEVSIQNNRLVTKIYQNCTDCQISLHVDSEHLNLLKASIVYSQVLRVKQIWTTPNDFNQYCRELKQKFVNQGYKPELINKHKSSKKNGQERTFKRKR